jgi:hypothetical protein
LLPDHSKSSAEQTRTTKEYLSELEKLKQVEQNLRSQLSEAEFASNSVQKMLATVVAEKERVVAENENLKELCEEAMSLAETHSSTT